jgi:signal transduction histidine kinase
MPSDPGSGLEFERLRILAIEDVRAARRLIGETLDGPGRDELLAKSSGPGEGRLRQLIANVVAGRPDRDDYAARFADWLDLETDEFARRAITAALRDVSARDRRRVEAPVIDPHLVECYRYVSERLTHEVRNAMATPWRHFRALRDRVGEIADVETRASLSALVERVRGTFDDLNRIVQFDADDDFFRLRPIAICGWVRAMSEEFSRRYKKVELVFEGDGELAVRIHANDFLLRLIFWNLWLNSHQATDGNCRIAVRTRLHHGELELAVVDNGAGLSAEIVGVAFRVQFSKAGGNRGRGLLEVQDAAERLHGRAELIPCPRCTGAYRVALYLPLEGR